MRLKQLRINGFKSFADTTVIEFPGAVSGIVGPNGCGKSNVIDAIRWVLGEGRVSELRGTSSMSELIFSGSSNRPASSRASVEMVMDNSDGTIAGAWGRYTELSIKRVVTRDGTNAYFINNQQVRRRDVHDIFLGTGLGPRSYAIISQGTVSNFVKAKPEELRVYLEEAAGVSKYKERRKETESALNSTRNNLEKVQYLQDTKRQEIERLTVEAEVARKWQGLEDERLATELLWYFVQESDAKNTIDKINAQIAQKETEMLECRGESQRLVVEIENLRQKAREMREAADAAREASWKANAKVAEIEGNIRHIVEQKDALTRQIAAQKEALSRRTNEKREALERIEELKRLHAENLEKAEVLDEEAAALEEESFKKNDEYEELRQKYDEARKTESQAQQKIGILQVKLEALSREYETVLERIESLRAETRPGAAPDQERYEELVAELEDKTAELEENTAQAEELAQLREEAQHAFDELRTTKERLSESVSRTTARLQTLEAVQAKAEGEGRLPEWLEKMGLNTLPKLFESLTVDSGWAVALEAVLSVKASALAMTELTRAAGFSYDAPPSRLVFYGKAVTETPAVTIEGFAPLSDFVSSDNALIDATVKAWLAGVFVADSVDVAVRNRDKLPAGARFAVKEGHIVDAVSISFWAEESTGAGLVSRAAEIRDLKEKESAERHELEAVSEKLIDAKAKVTDAEVHHKAKLAFIDAVRNQRHTLEVEYSALKTAIDAYRARSQKVAQELGELTARRDEVDDERQVCEAEFEELDAKFAVLQQATADAQVHLEDAEQALADIDDRVRQAKQSAQMARLEARNATERMKDAQDRNATADEEIELMNEQIEELSGRLEEMDETAEREGLGEVLADRDAKNEAHIRAEAESNAAENEVEAARARQQKLNDDQTPLLQEISDL
ncbi:MAG: AAA family ATPase, partial [Sutterellaceae bacterium]|nr:AAA family ATPase [Sutterellaceae bacterium]